MKRLLTYSVPPAFIGCKISEFLRNKGYSRQSLTDLKYMDGSIRIGGQNERMNYLLKKDDVLSVYICECESSRNIIPVELPFPIIYEDEDLLVINKPADMAIHPSMRHFDNTLGNAAAFYFAKQGIPFVYRCINRLDKGTSGLTILAKHSISSGVLYRMMKERSIKRTYLAIVEGSHLPRHGTIDLPLARKAESIIEMTVDALNGVRAITHYKVLKVNGGLSLLELHLDTGRTHQIRVHMKTIGHPLIGDFLYNPLDTRMNRQALHASSLQFTHPITGKELYFYAPYPNDMAEFIPFT